MKSFAFVFLLFAFPVHAQNLPDAPKPKLDRRVFITGVSLLAASKAADAWTTRNTLDRGGSENNPVFGRHPSPARQAVTNFGFFVGESALFYFTERNRHRWIRWVGRSSIGFSIANHTQLTACTVSAPRYRLHGETCHDWMPL